MARTRILKTIFEKIDPRQLQKQEREQRSRLKQLENQRRQQEEAERRRREKEEQRLQERKQLLQQRVQEALDKGQITAEEALWLPDLDTDRVVTWNHTPYIDQLTKLLTQIDNGEWEDACLYLTDKKDYNPTFIQYVKSLFGDTYSFEEHQPHANPYKERMRLRRLKAKETPEQEAEINLEPWADNLYDACAPHLTVTNHSSEGDFRFGIMTVWRKRFTKHGLAMMARSQFIKTKLFEQETGTPVFMLIGIGGTDQKPERLFIVPFTDIEDHFIPKPIAYKYEEDPNMQLHYIPELRKLK